MGIFLSRYRVKRHTQTIQSTLKPFMYQPLSETEGKIRLLRIPAKVSSEDQDKIDYTMFEAPLDTSELYIALSYSWGNPNPPAFIAVNGQLCSVTPSLAAALQNLQREEEEVTIWADALCINQRDPDEKTRQVQHMRDIYKLAKEVIIWLGPSTELTDNTMKEIRKLGAHLLDLGIWDLKSEDASNWNVNADDDSESARIKKKILDLVAHHLENIKKEQYDFYWIMSDVGARAWWRRIRCIQECANAKVATFRCGHEEVDFKVYWATAFYMQIFYVQTLASVEPDQQELFWRLNWLADKLMETFPTTLLGIRRINLTGGGHSLRTLLHLTSVHDTFANRVQATDDRDRVFALLGIANDEVAKEIVPDYRLTTREAYMVTARMLLKHGHDDMLSLCRIRNLPSNMSALVDKLSTLWNNESPSNDLPSWTPDWSALIRKPWSLWHEERMFDASRTGSIPMGKMASSGADEITLAGVFVDTISEVGSIWSIKPDDKFDHTSAFALLNDVNNYLSRSKRYDEKKKEEGGWRIPIGDIEFDAMSSPVQRARTDSHMKKGYDIVRTTAEKAGNPGDVSPHRNSYACYMAQMERMHDSRPLLSKDDYVGLCPMQAEVGDRIVIFLGARTPYIIRKVADTELWKIVGESHIYGIMDGEFMKSGPTVKDITLI